MRAIVAMLTRPHLGAASMAGTRPRVCQGFQRFGFCWVQVSSNSKKPSSTSWQFTYHAGVCLDVYMLQYVPEPCEWQVCLCCTDKISWLCVHIANDIHMLKPATS